MTQQDIRGSGLRGRGPGGSGFRGSGLWGSGFQGCGLWGSGLWGSGFRGSGFWGSGLRRRHCRVFSCISASDRKVPVADPSPPQCDIQNASIYCPLSPEGQNSPLTENHCPRSISCSWARAYPDSGHREASAAPWSGGPPGGMPELPGAS